jgi:hypothetical protein
MIRRVVVLASMVLMLLPGVARADSFSYSETVTVPGSWYVTSQTLTMYFTISGNCFDVTRITGKWHRISTYARVNAEVHEGWFGRACDGSGSLYVNPVYYPTITWTATSAYEANGTFTIYDAFPPFEVGPAPYDASGVILEGSVYYRNMYKGTKCAAVYLNQTPGCS